MVLSRLILVVLIALVAGAYWGTKADAKPRSSVHCLVFRFALIDGKQLVLLDQKPIGEVACPASRARRA